MSRIIIPRTKKWKPKNKSDLHYLKKDEQPNDNNVLVAEIDRTQVISIIDPRPSNTSSQIAVQITRPTTTDVQLCKALHTTLKLLGIFDKE